MSTEWVKHETHPITVQYEDKDENKAAIRPLETQPAKHNGTNSRKYQIV